VPTGRPKPTLELLPVLFACLALSLIPSPRVHADGIDGEGAEFDVSEDPILFQMRALDRIAPFEDLAPLWEHRDPYLQTQVEAALARLELDDDARSRRLSVVLVDVTETRAPLVASVNGDVMMYAASLPKIAVLLACFESIAQGKLELDAETETLMHDMIKESSNSASTELMHRVGKQNIARVLLSPRYRLYDPKHNGGLWVGKDYAEAGLWRRDPLHNLSHGATALQVARFYYMLETGNLVTPEYSAKMKEVLSGTRLDHKFAEALHRISPKAALFRKSGSWRTFHSDSALVKRGGRAYIAVALSDDADGKYWLGWILEELDAIIMAKRS
jgi:beta-lactamase class A